jgi:hypothetical protein
VALNCTLHDPQFLEQGAQLLAGRPVAASR